MNYLKNKYQQYFELDKDLYKIDDEIIIKIAENEYQEYLNDVLEFKEYVMDF